MIIGFEEEDFGGALEASLSRSCRRFTCQCIAKCGKQRAAIQSSASGAIHLQVSGKGYSRNAKALQGLAKYLTFSVSKVSVFGCGYL